MGMTNWRQKGARVPSAGRRITVTRRRKRERGFVSPHFEPGHSGRVHSGGLPGLRPSQPPHSGQRSICASGLIGLVIPSGTILFLPLMYRYPPPTRFTFTSSSSAPGSAGGARCAWEPGQSGLEQYGGLPGLRPSQPPHVGHMSSPIASAQPCARACRVGRCGATGCCNTR